MATRTERFERKAAPAPPPEPAEFIERFPTEEEAALLEESNILKTKANGVFMKGEYEDAVELYESALGSCPRYLYFERAVLKSNVSASYLKLEKWKDAVKAAGESTDLLDQAEGKKKKKEKQVEGTADVNVEEQNEEQEADEEIVSAGAAKVHDSLSVEGTTKREVDRIRTKVLLRRGKARVEIGSWSTLQGAEEDYKTLLTMGNLSDGDGKVVRNAIAMLPARIKVAQEKEMGEMMGKLKDLGNGILKPFGLSTNNFQMVKDEKTGGYSMNFNQGNK